MSGERLQDHWSPGLFRLNIYISHLTKGAQNSSSLCTLKQSYNRTFSISFFWQCANDIELIFPQICAFIWTTVW